MSLFFDAPQKQAKKTISSSTRKSGGTILTCEQCGLCNGCLSPKMPMSGKGKLGILIVAEAPGETEDEKGIQLIGQSGQLLRRTLEDLGYDLDEDFWKTNALICRPPKNRTPTNPEINACRKNLLATIEEVKPNAIIVLGAVAWKSLMTPRLAGRLGGFEFADWVGETIPDQGIRRWICPTYHPSYILRMEHDKIMAQHFKKHLETAIKMAKLPVTVTKYEELVETTTKEIKAVGMLATIVGCPEISFDYETTGKKPHAEGHEIDTLSFSDGNRAWSFPMFHGKAFQGLLKRVLTSPSIKKISHNARFEEDWTHTILGYDVVNMYWDTLIGAHCLNNKKPVGLKWLVYATYGIMYDDKMDVFVKAKADSCNAFNTIKDAPIEEKLKYNAYDSLFTYWLYHLQESSLDNVKAKGFDLFMEGDIALLKAHQHGMRIDVAMLEKQGKKAENKMERAEIAIMNSAEVKKWDRDETFNFNSPTQLAHLCYDILGAKVRKTTATEKPSADQETLEKMKFPFVKHILEYKKWYKAKGTYLGQFERERVGNIVRPYFNLSTVDTFRSSSSDPNFQNLPKHDKEIMDFVRRIIVPRPGHRLIEYDYASMEVRILACYNHDPVLIDFIKGGGDMHQEISSWLFIREVKDIRKEERQWGKNCYTFPTFYGSYWENTGKDLWNAMDEELRAHMKEQGIKNLEHFQEHVKQVDRKFWGRFPVANEWMKKTLRDYEKTGFIDMFTGFRCYGPMKRTQIINYRIQGSAFHCLLYTMTNVTREMEKRKFDSYFIGQIHDSLVSDVCPDEQKELGGLVKLWGTDKIREHWKWIIVPLGIEQEASEINGNMAEMSDKGVL